MSGASGTLTTMDEVNRQDDPLTMMDARAFLDGVSRRQRVRFGAADSRLRCTIGRSHTVHTVVDAEWIGGVPILVPACRIGISGWNLDRMHPTSEPASCRRAACQSTAATAHRAAPSTKPAPRHRSPVGEQQQLLLDLSA